VHLQLRVFTVQWGIPQISARIDREAPKGYWWSPPEEISGEALPSVMKKVLETALPGITRKRPRN
jgi:hypothetical protein